MTQVSPQGYVYEDGVQVVDPDWVEMKADIQAFKMVYAFPDDMRELLLLRIDVAGYDFIPEFYIEGRTIVLKNKPTSWINNAITIHYRRKSQ